MQNWIVLNKVSSVATRNECSSKYWMLESFEQLCPHVIKWKNKNSWSSFVLLPPGRDKTTNNSFQKFKNEWYRPQRLKIWITKMNCSRGIKSILVEHSWLDMEWQQQWANWEKRDRNSKWGWIEFCNRMVELIWKMSDVNGLGFWSRLRA